MTHKAPTCQGQVSGIICGSSQRWLDIHGGADKQNRHTTQRGAAHVGG